LERRNDALFPRRNRCGRCHLRGCYGTADHAADERDHVAQPFFATEAEAKRHCDGRAIVWVVASERVYYAKGDAGYGRAGEGAYMCEDEARGDGNRRAGKGWREAVAPALATGVAR
jgi:hypothetical protein